MFTGLIQDVGLLQAIRPDGDAVHLQIQTKLAEVLAVGDSLAVQGVCLTATAVGSQYAVATAIFETLSRTTLGTLQTGARINLEPALRVGDRLGGHIVQGHVDGIGTITRITERGLSREITIEASSDLIRYIVVKGSVAIDGVSLTVAAAHDMDFTVALIPHTQSVTTIGQLKIGERVNLETDVLAKYVEKLLGGATSGGGATITEQWLREQGF